MLRVVEVVLILRLLVLLGLLLIDGGRRAGEHRVVVHGGSCERRSHGKEHGGRDVRRRVVTDRRAHTLRCVVSREGRCRVSRGCRVIRGCRVRNACWISRTCVEVSWRCGERSSRGLGYNLYLRLWRSDQLTLGCSSCSIVTRTPSSLVASETIESRVNGAVLSA